MLQNGRKKAKIMHNAAKKFDWDMAILSKKIPVNLPDLYKAFTHF